MSWSLKERLAALLPRLCCCFVLPWQYAKRRADLEVVVLDDDAKERPRRTLFMFTLHSKVRRWCIRIAESRAFEMFIIAVIVANIVALAMYQPQKSGTTLSTRNKRLGIAEMVFTCIFTVEMLIKVIAYGFVISAARLHNNWNRLDFVIVVSGLAGWSSFIGGSGSNVEALRGFRLLRPLRRGGAFPSLQLVMQSVVMSLPLLMHIFCFALFIILFYGLVGLSFFMGRLRREVRRPYTRACGQSRWRRC